MALSTGKLYHFKAQSIHVSRYNLTGNSWPMTDVTAERELPGSQAGDIFQSAKTSPDYHNFSN